MRRSARYASLLCLGTALFLPGCIFISGLLPKCGDGVQDPDEACDLGDLAGQDCASQGFSSGTLACAADCKSFDTSACVEACGNNAIDAGEACDGQNLNGQSCATQGFFAGTLACSADCQSLDTSGCTNCGNDTIDAGETCDGTDLN